MPLDIRNAESAFARGNAQFEIFRRKFMHVWNKPLAQTQVAMLLHSQPRESVQTIPPDVLERLGSSLDLSLVEEEEDAPTEI
jgi:hypothetical protein